MAWGASSGEGIRPLVANFPNLTGAVKSVQVDFETKVSELTLGPTASSPPTSGLTATRLGRAAPSGTATGSP